MFEIYEIILHIQLTKTREHKQFSYVLFKKYRKEVIIISLKLQY